MLRSVAGLDEDDLQLLTPTPAELFVIVTLLVTVPAMTVFLVWLASRVIPRRDRGRHLDDELPRVPSH